MIASAAFCSDVSCDWWCSATLTEDAVEASRVEQHLPAVVIVLQTPSTASIVLLSQLVDRGDEIDRIKDGMALGHPFKQALRGKHRKGHDQAAI